MTLEAALDLDPDAPAAFFGIANNYLFGEPKDFAKAEEWARKAIAAYPDEAKGYEVLGDVKRAQSDLDGALAAYNQATEADATLEVAQHKKGHVSSFLGQIEEARAAYDAAIAAAPPESKAGYAVFRAFTHIHGGDVPGALDELEELADNVAAMGTPADQVKGLQVFALTSGANAALHAGLSDRAKALVARRKEVGTEDRRRLQEANCHLWDGLVAAYEGSSDAAAKHAAKSPSWSRATTPGESLDIRFTVSPPTELRYGEESSSGLLSFSLRQGEMQSGEIEVFSSEPRTVTATARLPNP